MGVASLLPVTLLSIPDGNPYPWLCGCECELLQGKRTASEPPLCSRPLRVTPFGTDKLDGKFGQQNVLIFSFSENSSHGVDALPSPTPCSCESSHPVRKGPPILRHIWNQAVGKAPRSIPPTSIVSPEASATRPQGDLRPLQMSSSLPFSRSR